MTICTGALSSLQRVRSATVLPINGSTALLIAWPSRGVMPFGCQK
jgi:hypothetical protein